MIDLGAINPGGYAIKGRICMHTREDESMVKVDRKDEHLSTWIVMKILGFHATITQDLFGFLYGWVKIWCTTLVSYVSFMNFLIFKFMVF